MKKFTSFVTSAYTRGLIRTGFISQASPGTAWWLLSPRQSEPTEKSEFKDLNMSVYSVFQEFTPADPYIVARQFDGIIPTYLPAPICCSDTIRNVPGIRGRFLTEA